MSRVTTRTKTLYDELKERGAWELSESQLQLAVDARLGPSRDADYPTSHWRAVSALAVRDKGRQPRLPPADDVAVDLAIDGYPCLRLKDAVLMMIAVNDHPSNPEQVAEELMRSAQRPGENETYLPRIAKRMLDGAVARPGVKGEDAQLERLGQAHAVATTMSEVAGGAPPTVALDPDDVAQVFGIPVEIVRAYIPAFEATFGPGNVLDNIDSLVKRASSDELAIALRAASALVPLFEGLVVPLGSARTRRRWVATAAPLMLVVGRLYGELVAVAGGKEAAARLPSIFPPDDTGLRPAQDALRNLLPAECLADPPSPST